MSTAVLPPTVGLGENRCRDLHESDAAHVACSRESGQVAGDSAAERDERVGARESVVRQEIIQPDKGCVALGGLAVGEYELDGAESVVRQGLHHSVGIQPVHGVVGHNAHMARLYCRGNVIPGVIEKSAADDYIVAAACVYMYFLHNALSFLMVTLILL